MGNPNIYILGAGNIGKYVAHALMKQKGRRKNSIRLLVHRESRLDEWDQCGRAIRRIIDGTEDVAQDCLVEQVKPDSVVPRIYNLIVATKAHATVDALKSIRKRLSRFSSIIFLQNGMGTVERVSRYVFQDTFTRPSYWAGICSAGITNSTPLEPFSFVHAGRGPLTIGLIDNTTNTPLPYSEYMTRRLMDAPELETEIVSREQIARAQVKKLVVNSIINPLTAILGCKNGELLETQVGRQLMDLLLEEAGPIAREVLLQDSHDKRDPVIINRDLSDDALRDAVHTVATDTAQNTSSMLQDVRAGRQTEIDFINNYLVSRGARLNLPRRYHAAVVQVISEPEKWLREQRPPEEWLSLLREKARLDAPSQ